MSYCKVIVSSLVFLVGIFIFSSCYRSVDSYRKEYRDPALFGEWLNVSRLEAMQTDSQFLEKVIRSNGGFSVGCVFFPDGKEETIYIVYEEGSETPKLERGYSGIYYTEGNILHGVFGINGSAPTNVPQGYEVRGDILYISLSLDPQDPERRHVYRRQKVTANLFPKYPSKSSDK